jgi:uncharacterized membrane protein
MAYCSTCGSQLPDNTTACPDCTDTASTLANPPEAAKGEIKMADSGLAENVAGLLCYVGGWITGLIFFLIDKRPFVRFHAAQSIVVFGGLQIAVLVLRQIFFQGFVYGGYGVFSLGALLIEVLEFIGVVLWIVLMVKAYQGEKYRLPVAASLADSLAGK